MHSSRMRTARSSSCPGGISTRYPPGADTPSWEQAPPWTRHPREQDPLEQAPLPWTRHPSPEQAPPSPQTRHPPGPGTPWSRHPPGAGNLRTRHPPVDRHTPVNILPCPKLRLRAVIRRICNIGIRGFIMWKQTIAETKCYLQWGLNWEPLQFKSDALPSELTGHFLVSLRL